MVEYWENMILRSINVIDGMRENGVIDDDRHAFAMKRIEKALSKNKRSVTMDRIYFRKSKRNITRLIFHHFGESVPDGVDVPAIRAMHINDREWDDIGYQGVIMPDGSLSLGRDVDQAGAHTWGFNKGSIGIMFVAGSPEGGVTKPNDKQLATARAIIDEQLSYYGKLEVLGHRDLRATHCPGFDVKRWRETGIVS